MGPNTFLPPPPKKNKYIYIPVSVLIMGCIENSESLSYKLDPTLFLTCYNICVHVYEFFPLFAI